MLKKMIGLAAVLVAASAAPALACPCNQPTVSYGVEQQVVVPQAPQPRYYVNQGPTFTGPDTYAPEPVYQEHGVTGYYPYVSSYPRPYSGGPYADPYNHYSYGSTTSQGPVVYTYRQRYHYAAPVRRYRAAPRYYLPRYAVRTPRYIGPRFHKSRVYRSVTRYGAVAPSYRAAPRYGYAPRPRFAPRYGAAPRLDRALRYGVEPRFRGPRNEPRVGYDVPRSRNVGPRPRRLDLPAPRYMN